jgi:subtilisin family serine protease
MSQVTVTWGQTGRADGVRVTRLPDTSANRAALLRSAKQDRLPSALVDMGADVALLSGARLATPSPVSNAEGLHVRAGRAVKVDGVAGSVLTSDDGFTEIDASRVVVAVIDTGLDMAHPAFKGRVVAPFNAVDGSTDVSDRIGHGTAVAGVIAGRRGLRDDASGVAVSARIMPIKAVNAKGLAEPKDVARGIDHAVRNGAKIINMSLGADAKTLKKLGYWEQVPLLEAAVARARKAGVLVVVSSGNEGRKHLSDYHPAHRDDVLAVGALNRRRERAWFSNAGKELDLTAPGVDVVTAKPGQGRPQYKEATGTSFAAPYVAGAAALVMAQHPDWSVRQVEQHLRRAVTDRGTPGKDDFYGHGAIDLRKAAFESSLSQTPAPHAGPTWGERMQEFFCLQ